MCVQAREEKLQRENSAVKEKLKTVQGQMRAVVLKLERIEDKRESVQQLRRTANTARRSPCERIWGLGGTTAGFLIFCPVHSPDLYVS